MAHEKLAEFGTNFVEGRTQFLNYKFLDPPHISVRKVEKGSRNLGCVWYFGKYFPGK